MATKNEMPFIEAYNYKFTNTSILIKPICASYLIDNLIVCLINITSMRANMTDMNKNDRIF